MLEGTTAHWFKCTQEVLDLSQNFSVCKSCSYTRSIFGPNPIFPSAFIKACLMLIQNNSNCWIETTQMEIKESPQYKFYNNIGDLLLRSFWYYNSDTKRNPLVMLCWHCPINDSSGYLPNAVYLVVMLQASWHTAESN